MPLQRLVVCSLKTHVPQGIQPNVWQTVRFPFSPDPETGEPYDPDDLHTRLAPPNPVPTDSTMPEAGLIWPRHDAWVTWQGFMVWQKLSTVPSSERPTLFRHRFIRDPFAYTSHSAQDTTATENVAPCPVSTLSTCKPTVWNFWGHPDTPVAYQVWHNADRTIMLDIAEFKASYTVWED